MQYRLLVECAGCDKRLGWLECDTADMPVELQAKVNKIVLSHRPDCAYYGGSVVTNANSDGGE